MRFGRNSLLLRIPRRRTFVSTAVMHFIPAKTRRIWRQWVALHTLHNRQQNPGALHGRVYLRRSQQQNFTLNRKEDAGPSGRSHGVSGRKVPRSKIALTNSDMVGFHPTIPRCHEAVYTATWEVLNDKIRDISNLRSAC